ncbi:MAG: cytochrome P460 family protein [Pseudomonadota bacterium]
MSWKASAFVLGAGLLGLGLMTGVAVSEEPRVSFPADYKTTFENYLSLDRVQNPDQIIRLYANDIALKAAREGKELPNGSVLVGEVYKAKKDAEGNIVESSLGRRVRDKFAAVAVMEKGEGWGEKYPVGLKNGDWDFAIFSPDGKPLNKDLNTCRSCHAPMAATQYLFSLEHIGQ